jgi:hypothetical protein
VYGPPLVRKRHRRLVNVFHSTQVLAHSGDDSPPLCLARIATIYESPRIANQTNTSHVRLMFAPMVNGAFSRSRWLRLVRCERHESTFSMLSVSQQDASRPRWGPAAAQLHACAVANLILSAR